MKAIIAALGGGAATDKIWGEGVHITGEKYVVTKAEDRSIYGRKVSFFIPSCPSYLQPAALLRNSKRLICGLLQGKEGVVICKTTQAILIAHYGENVQAGNAAATVEKLADYLVGLGY